MTDYRIVRFFSDQRPRKTVKIVKSLEAAQEWCSSPITKGELRDGTKWFDGYEEKGRSE
jgi:hypothetical protein